MDEVEKGRAEYRSQLNQIRMSYLYDTAKISEQATVDLALTGFRSLLIANGGAMIALLTFVGNYGENLVVETGLWWSFSFFAAGLACGLAAMLLAYLSQGAASQVSNDAAESIFFALHGDVETAEALQTDTKPEINRTNYLRSLSIAFATVSGFTFAIGVASGLFALSA